MKKLSKFISLTLSMTLTATSLLTPNLFTRAVDTAPESTDGGEIAATSSIGSTLMGLVGEQESDNAETTDTGCNINDLTFDAAAKTVTVSSVQNTDCRLTIGLYNDGGTELLESKTLDITADSSDNTVTLTSELPEYYLIKAFLTDDLQRPLCKARAYEDATQEMQKIKAAAVSDFDQSLVINLDESSDTNFLVLSEDAVTAASSDTVNTLVSEDVESGVYTFDNIDETVSGLQAGDIFCVQPSEDDIVAIVVESAVISGDTAEITADKEKASQIFDLIKIEADSAGAQPTVDMSEATEGVVAVDEPGDDFFKEYEDKINSDEEIPRFDPNADEEQAADEAVSSQAEPVEASSLSDGVSLSSTNLRGGIGDIDKSGSGSVSQSFSFGSKLATKAVNGYDLSLSTSTTFSADISFTFYHDTKFFAKDYNYLDFRVSQTTEEGFSIEIGYDDDIKEILKKSPKNDEIKLGKVSIPLGPTGLDVAFEIKVVYSFKGAITITETKSSVSGTTYSTDEGWNKVKESPDPEVSLKAEGEFMIGVQLGGALEFVEGLVSIGLPITVGLKISASADLTQGITGQYPSGNVTTRSETDDNLHLCGICIDGDISLELDISVEASLLYGIIDTQLSLFNISVKLGDFYWNFHDRFQWGECPNQFSKVTVTVVDDKGKKLSGADVSIGNVSLKTDSTGKAVFYVRDGSNETITAKFGGNTSTLQIAVRGYALSKTISIDDDVSNTASASAEFEGHTYQIFDSGLVWEEAEAFCESIGGHLVTITSEEEQNMLNELFGADSKNCYWTGGMISDNDGSWVTGEEFSYTNWAPNEPNNTGNQESYIHLFGQVWTGGNGIKEIGMWNDSSAEGAGYSNQFYALENFGFICEWDDSDDAAVVATTTTAAVTTTAVTTTTVDINDIVYRAAVKPTTVDGMTSFTFDKAAAGTEYLLAACTNADDVLGSLVYIDQRTADENGVVAFTFAEPTVEVTYVFVGDFGRGDCCRTSGTLDIENETCTICGHAVSDIIAAAGIDPGDVNGDGAVDSSDAALILQHYALIQSDDPGKLTEAAKIVADYNNDGSVDSSDAALILKAYANSQAA